MPQVLLVSLGGLATTYIFLRFVITLTQDAREPPVVETAIPFLSPMIGMRKKAQYHIDLRRVHVY